MKLLCWLARREPVKGVTFLPDQTTTWRRRTYRTSVRMVVIGRICLAIRTENGAEISICPIEMFFMRRLSLSHSKLLLNVNCVVEVFILYTR